MNTYLFTWNPRRWAWDDFEDYLQMTARGRRRTMPWSTGNNKSVVAGERFFLVRQATGRGIIGAGSTISDVFLGPHWDGSEAEVKSVTVEFETLLPIADALSIDDLEAADLGIKWNRIQASGIRVPPDAAARLEMLWRRHLTELGFYPDEQPNEIVAPERFIEGAVRRVVVNAYERNPAARRTCIDHHGLNCAVCGFNFSQCYGELGEGFIHVHHLRELASIGEEYEVDPVADLRPVCPNCHAILHRRTPAMSIEALRAVIASQHSRSED